ncbi:MAG: hypothetical protein IK008_06700 [Bacteroidales bacterium]|nr:hypothetical protein [Bacteroidales bacterium]
MKRLITFLSTLSILAAVSAAAANEKVAAVDLGLSVKWANCNLGATAPEKYGDYYAWGETAPKQEYNWETYKWCNGSYDSLTKYNTNRSYGRVDYKTVLDPKDDAARVRLGGRWRIPTDDEWKELIENCTWTLTTQGASYGYKVTSEINGKSIFLPAAFFLLSTDLDFGYYGCDGNYWSSSLNTDDPSYAWGVSFDSDHVYMASFVRYHGFSVRPVLDPDPAPVEKLTAVDLGLSVKWANCNLGATTPKEYGDYYAWGETAPKQEYSFKTYKWCDGSYESLTRYNTKSTYGTADNKTVLDLEDDVVRVELGGKWRMPTDEEWTELRTNCTWTWTSQSGINGYMVTSRINGKSIFLPAAGNICDTMLLGGAGYSGCYWSSSLYTDVPYCAWYVRFDSDDVGRSHNGRSLGQSVRPVTE